MKLKKLEFGKGTYPRSKCHLYIGILFNYEIIL
jgi:hypothetical protein